MVKVVVGREGAEDVEVSLFPAQRVFAIGAKAGLDRLGFGDCGGQCVCATCHVDIIKGDFDAPRDDELRLLDTLPNVTPTSRLACQLTAGEQDEIVLRWLGT
ncbi:MAG: 2Fe-2S ferredoxin [Alphaproteobacteria bacterium CG_4_10_14_0_8_um_filter_53_9]|nr:MAG: 2Fe-2S ferredoxin [Alphaproteobacteria bacterium CG_4_10_14_0_8_um_filter_53_9]